jgi:putative membrane protein
MIAISDLPALNATLNFTATIFLSLGYYFIRQKRIQAHKLCMLAAVVISALFLTSYLIYHYNAGSAPFTKRGWIRSVYFPILISHIILAALSLPLILRTVYLALTSRFDQHRRLARWTFPVWMYVSVTGVIVYLMLYRL